MTAAKYVAAYGMSRHEVRTLLFERQGGDCGICEEPLPKGYLHSRWVDLDHWHCRSHGGPDVIANLRITHRACNNDKGPACGAGSPCDICFPED